MHRGRETSRGGAQPAVGVYVDRAARPAAEGSGRVGLEGTGVDRGRRRHDDLHPRCSTRWNAVEPSAVQLVDRPRCDRPPLPPPRGSARGSLHRDRVGQQRSSSRSPGSCPARSRTRRCGRGSVVLGTGRSRPRGCGHSGRRHSGPRVVVACEAVAGALPWSRAPTSVSGATRRDRRVPRKPPPHPHTVVGPTTTMSEAAARRGHVNAHGVSMALQRSAAGRGGHSRYRHGGNLMGGVLPTRAHRTAGTTGRRVMPRSSSSPDCSRSLFSEPAGTMASRASAADRRLYSPGLSMYLLSAATHHPG